MRFYIAILIFISTIVFAFAPGAPTGDVPPLTAETAWRTIDGFKCLFDETREVARYAFPNEPIYFSTDRQTMIAQARTFIDEHPAIFGMSSSGFISGEPVERIGRYWLNFHQENLGIRVLDGEIYFRLFGDGRLWACGSKAFYRFEPENGLPAIDCETARQNALIYTRYEIGQESASLPIDLDLPSELVWFPDDGIAKLAWQVTTAGNRPDIFRMWVSTQTGEILGWNNLVKYQNVSGDVGILFLPAYLDEPYDTGIFVNGGVSFNQTQDTLTDETGHYSYDIWWDGGYLPLRSWLVGLHVFVLRMDGPQAFYARSIYPPTIHSWIWNDDMAIPDELNLYYHTNYIHDWYKTLDPEMTGLDYPVPSRCQDPIQPGNATWDGYGANYGGGDMYLRNLALFSNVIYHEYTHGVSDWIYRDFYFPYSDEPGAINEAFSDYFACSNNNTQYAGDRLATDDTYLRDLVNDSYYPDDWYGEPHADGIMISGAFWDMRMGVYPGRTTWADSIVHFTRYSGISTYDDFAIECFFTADDDGDISNGCTNLALIANSFARHGIGPGYFPTLDATLDSIIDLGDGDGFIGPDEEFQVFITIEYFNDFPYPTALDVYAIGAIDDPQIEALDTYNELGDIENGGEVVASFTFVTDDDILPHYVDINVSAGNPELDSISIGDFEIAIGAGQVLLVNADSGDTYTPFITDALYEIPCVFGSVSATDTTPTEVEMSRFPTVLWFSGDAANALSTQNIADIEDYLESGGSMILTGQDGFDDPAYTDFLDQYFGASIEGDSIFAFLVRGVSGDTIGEHYSMMISGSAGANNQRRPSTLLPTVGTEFAYYAIGDEPIAAIRYSGDCFKTAIIGFGLEAVTSTGAGENLSRWESVLEILEWFGIQIYSEVEERAGLPVSISAKAYPNPFNSSLTFEIATDGDFTLEIFDLAGRQLLHESGVGSRNIAWNADGLGSGIYLYRVNLGNIERCSKIILIK